MKCWRSRAAAAALVLSAAAAMGGCWGRAFVAAPRETLATSSKIDSLLRENALLGARVAAIEALIARQDERERGASAQHKGDLEELKDQLNSIAEMLREAQETPAFAPVERRRTPLPDTTRTRSAAPPAQGGAPTAEAPSAPGGDTSVAAATPSAQRGAGDSATADGDAAGAAGLAPAPEELYRQIYIEYSRREYQLALDESDAFLSEYPDDPLFQEILSLRGQSIVELGKQLEALKEFSTLLQRYPGGKRAPGSLLRMAISYESMGQLELAAGVVRRLIAEHPRSSEAAVAEERFKSILQE